MGRLMRGSGPYWLFDIDLLTNSMNYEPVTSLEDAVADDAGKKTNEEPANKGEGKGYVNSTNRDSTLSPSVSTARQNSTNADDLPTIPLMPDLEDIGIFSGTYDDEDVGAEADLNNLETTMNVSHIPTTRIQKDHPKDQIIGDINLATQTKRMTKISKEHAMERISHKKTKNQAKKRQNKTRDGKVCEDEAQSKSRADYANLGNFIYKRKKGEKENEKKKDVEGLFLYTNQTFP
ncbi:hypothetical protein Tco_1563746 [Tanacetum coccineum]